MRRISAYERKQETRSLFETAPALPFDGETYDAARDGARLGRQLAAVLDMMRDGRWHTLAELSQACEGSEPSVSARIRDIRKAKFGAYAIEREYIANGIWRYRLDLSTR